MSVLDVFAYPMRLDGCYPGSVRKFLSPEAELVAPGLRNLGAGVEAMATPSEHAVRLIPGAERRAVNHAEYPSPWRCPREFVTLMCEWRGDLCRAA